MVIAERTFTLGGESVRLEVRRPEPDQNDFRCAYRYSGAGLERESYAMGVDPVQAVLLALSKAHLDLLSHRRDTGLPVLWLGQRDLGLPLPDNVSAADFDEGRD